MAKEPTLSPWKRAVAKAQREGRTPPPPDAIKPPPPPRPPPVKTQDK